MWVEKNYYRYLLKNQTMLEDDKISEKNINLIKIW